MEQKSSTPVNGGSSVDGGTVEKHWDGGREVEKKRGGGRGVSKSVGVRCWALSWADGPRTANTHTHTVFPAEHDTILHYTPVTRNTIQYQASLKEQSPPPPKHIIT